MICQRKLIGAAIVAVVFTVAAFAAMIYGIANPAAVYCHELGYQYSIKSTDEGEYGFCHLPDGTDVEEWKFLKGEVGKEYSYCKQKGYEIKTVSDERCGYNTECAVCVLKDGSEIEVTKLMETELNGTEKFSDRDEEFVAYKIALMISVVVGIVVLVAWRRRKEN